MAHERATRRLSASSLAAVAVTVVEGVALVTYFGYKGGISLCLKRIPVAWFYR
jgi:hypothetical protein